MMTDRRLQPRLTANELAMISYEQEGMRVRQLTNIDDISSNGAGMIVDHPVVVGTAITMTYGEGELAAVVRHCTALAEGHFIGVEFVGSSRASTLHFQPELLT
jgi:PilZ domain